MGLQVGAGSSSAPDAGRRLDVCDLNDTGIGSPCPGTAMRKLLRRLHEECYVLYIAVIGPNEASSDDCQVAREVGRLLGIRGIVVLTGGLGGVMAAAAEGCVSAGGTALGLLPHGDRRHASEHLSLSLPTGLGEMRNGLLTRSAHGVIAVGGSWGTLSELAMAMRTGIPVVCLNGWTIRSERGDPVPLLTAASPGRAVRKLLDLVEASDPPQ
jgi:uncharacterized protein (TIGR00725 family)